jgi:3-dehydroquinate dehydratase II
MKVLIINGPNLNLTGKREPSLYGTESFEEWLEELKKHFAALTIDYYQSNHAGELIDRLQSADAEYNGVIINPGGYTHTSIAMGDAVAAMKIPVVEVHMTNTLSREKSRHTSNTGPHCRGIITGFGLESYRLAMEGLVRTVLVQKEKRPG